MKHLIISLLGALVFFAGCADDGMAVNSPGGNKVARYFQEGVVLSQKKVIVDESMTATLSGAGVGALGGMAVGGDDAKGAAIGALVGGLAGALIGKEVVAYETTILSEGKKYTAYLKGRLVEGSVVEFTIKDDKLKNVNVLSIEPY